MRTPLGPTQSVLIRGVSLFQGLFYIHKMRLGPHKVSALQWMSIFQGCPQGEVPRYRVFCMLYAPAVNLCWPFYPLYVSACFFCGPIAPSLPLVPQDLTVVDVTYNSATILWTVAEISYTVEMYVVKYGLQVDLLTSESAVVSGGVDFLAVNRTMSIQLTELVHLSKYFFVVEARNSEGVTVTTERTFETSKASELHTRPHIHTHTHAQTHTYTHTQTHS